MTVIFLTGFAFHFSHCSSPSLFLLFHLIVPLFCLSDHPSLPFSSSFSISTPSCPSSPLVRSCCLASKEALERIHQPDQYSLEDASSMLLCSALLTIISIQPQIAFTVDHKTCFQICCKAVCNSMPCWTPTTIPLIHSPKVQLGLRNIFMNTGYVCNSVCHHMPCCMQ